MSLLWNKCYEDQSKMEVKCTYTEFLIFTCKNSSHFIVLMFHYAATQPPTQMRYLSYSETHFSSFLFTPVRVPCYQPLCHNCFHRRSSWNLWPPKLCFDATTDNSRWAQDHSERCFEVLKSRNHTLCRQVTEIPTGIWAQKVEILNLQDTDHPNVCYTDFKTWLLRTKYLGKTLTSELR